MKALKIISTFCLMAFFIIDLFLDEYFLEHSSNISAWLQQNGSSPLKAAGIIFSYIFAFIQIPVAYFYFAFSRNQLKALYYFTLYTLPIVIGVWLKVLYYKGRPWVVNADVSGEACDPGMPSGHSIMATSGYYVLYLILTEDLYPKKKVMHVFFAILCGLIAVCIMLSRISLGDHSYNQVLMGLLVGWNTIMYYDYRVFIIILHKFRHMVLPVTMLLNIFNIVMLMVMNSVNHIHRENYGLWKYFSKNPSCNNTFILGSALTVPLNSWVLCSWGFFPFKETKRQDKRPARYGLSGTNLRLLLHFLTVLPSAFLAPLAAVIQDGYSSPDSIVLMSNLLSLWLTFVFMVLGWGMVRLSKVLFEWANIAGREDYIFIEDINEQYRLLRRADDETKDELRDQMIGGPELTGEHPNSSDKTPRIPISDA